MSEQQIIGSYRLETPLKQSKPAAWRARHLVNGELFLLRQWRYDLEQGAYVELMKRIANLRHGNVRPILEFGLDQPGNAWSITQIPTGVRISEQLNNQGLPPTRAGMELAFGVSCALEAAHAARIYHGHLSTDEVYWENGRIVVDGWGAVWDADDGLARDLSALRQLTTAVISDLPDSVRALVDSPPQSVGAFRRALASALSSENSDPRPILPHQGPDELDDLDLDDHTVETSAHLSGIDLASDASSLDASFHSAARSRSSTEHIDPQASTAEHTWDSFALQDSWGLGLAEGEEAEGWLDGTREEIRGSNRYRPEHEDNWGVNPSPVLGPASSERHDELPSGMRVHTVSTDANMETPGEAKTTQPLWQWVLGLLLLGAVGLYLAQGGSEGSKESRVVQDEASETRATTVAPNTSKATPSTPQAGRIVKEAAAVTVTFAPVAVTVTRAKDGVKVCEDSRECVLPIDIDYTASHPGYESTRISGDDLYDRRNIGRMRVVLEAK